MGSMVRAASANFERYNGTTIMSATASAGAKRSPGSWRAFWPPPSLTATRFRGPGRRALLVVIVMAGLGLGGPGVSVPRAAGASDAVRAQIAPAVAGIRYFASQIHNRLLHAGSGRLITVSLQGQQLIAFDQGRVIVDTLVTTGRPALPTDVGAMQVLRRDAPWTMKSPWPRGSADWYPDTPVRMVVWFTKNGEGLHDASWQPDATLGPGSQNGPYASHGCIHVPLSAVRILFNWAPVGTPVVVYPGDGSPVANQVAQQSVDALGNPTSGVRGD